MASEARSESFDAAVERFCDLLEGRKGSRGPEDDIRTIMRTLTRLLQSSYPTLSDSEGTDIADEALVRFIQAVRDGRVDRSRSSAAYLTVIAKNEAVSRLRSAKGARLSEPEGLEDDALYALLDATAAQSEIDAAWETAKERNDPIAVRVVSAWIDLAARLRRAPTTREVGELAGVSHTTVRNALKRFRSYFPDRGPDA